MDLNVVTKTPIAYDRLVSKSEQMGFSMPSDVYVGAMLKTLVASKPKGHFLELGTGVGLSLSWMVDGMDDGSWVTSVDNDQELITMVNPFFDKDPRVTLICQDGAEWIKAYQGDPFDLVFADAWPGKYSYLGEVLDLLKPGGLYVIDDMMEQPNWPKGHSDHVVDLINRLEDRNDIELTKMQWSTGIIIAAKK